MANAQLTAAKDKSKGAIRLEVVTPEGQVLETYVDEFTAPSVNGTFGVLPGHLPLLASLGTGIFTYTRRGDTTTCAVGEGFVEVADSKAVIITDRYAEKDSVDPVSVRSRLEELNQEISSWEGDIEDPERHSLIAEELWLATLLELYGDPPPPVVRTNKLPAPSMDTDIDEQEESSTADDER